MSKHKWYHFLFQLSTSGSYKNTLLDWNRTVTNNYQVRIDKCSICNEWKVIVSDIKNIKFHNTGWVPREEAIQWMKDNDYEHVL